MPLRSYGSGVKTTVRLANGKKVLVNHAVLEEVTHELEELGQHRQSRTQEVACSVQSTQKMCAQMTSRKALQAKGWDQIDNEASSPRSPMSPMPPSSVSKRRSLRPIEPVVEKWSKGWEAMRVCSSPCCQR